MTTSGAAAAGAPAAAAGGAASGGAANTAAADAAVGTTGADAAAGTAGTVGATAAPALSAADAAVPASPLARRLAAALGIPLVGLAGRGPGGRVTAGDVRDRAGLSDPAGPVPSAPAGVSASPVARRMAARAGVDLTTLRGSGPRGRIVKLDVQAALDAVVPAPPAAVATPAPSATPETAKGTTTVVAPSRAQQVVARRMDEAKSTVPEFTVSSDVEMGACVELRGRLKRLAAEGTSVPSYNDMVVKAVALALREHPRVNGAYRDGAFELYSRVNVGVAVAAGDGLVVPTVFDADTTPLAEIASRGRELIEAVRAGRITPAELSGGTFTVSNLGMFGVTHFTAVLNVPQAAILAVGALEPRPLVRDGALVAGHAMSLTLTCDHRIVYGADAARFLAHVRQLLEEPLALLV